MSIFDKANESKKKMNLIRWNYKYIIVPAIILINILALTLFILLFTMLDVKLIYIVIVFLCSFLSSIMYLFLVNKKISNVELGLELKKHNFDYSVLEEKKYYQLNLVDVNGTQEYITFMNGKLHMFGQTYDYSDLWFYFVSNNEYKIVNLDIKIYFSNPSNINASYILLELDNQMLMILKQYDIKIENEIEFQYLLNNKEDAFKQILKYSKIK